MGRTATTVRDRAYLALATLCLLLAARPALACEHARMHRLIPLGWASGSLLAVELDIRRLDPPALRHEGRIVSLGPAGERRVLVDLQDTSGSRQDFERALAWAGQQTGFTPARVVWREDCGFLNRCSLGRGGGAARLWVSSGWGDATRVERLVWPAHLVADDWAHPGERDPWVLGTLTLYEAGGTVVLIAHGGVGREPCDVADPQACEDAFVPRPIVHGAASGWWDGEDFLFHGHTADVVVRMDPPAARRPAWGAVKREAAP